MARRSPIEIYAHAEPRHLKAVIGAADLVVGSRFHAVVGSLSQGVPTITLGWAHKYDHLHRDFEVPDWIAQIADDPGSRVGQILRDADGVRRARDRKLALLEQVEQMWLTTYEVLGVE
jgi:colanic acid/amylovoran biosynthesis protein